MTDMKMMKVTIEGFEFEVNALYSGDTDLERFNTYLKDKFSKFGIKNHMSHLYPELFPDYIGLQADANLCLKLKRYTRDGLDDCGEYVRGYEACSEDNIEKYKDGIPEYFRLHEPEFYCFIANRIG